MTASQYAKSVGLKSLKELSETIDTSVQTLNNWHKHIPLRFEAACLGGCTMIINKKAKEAHNDYSTGTSKSSRF